MEGSTESSWAISVKGPPYAPKFSKGTVRLQCHGKKMSKPNDKITLRLPVYSGWGGGGEKSLDRNRNRDKVIDGQWMTLRGHVG